MTDEKLTRLIARVDANLARLPFPAPEQTSRGLAASLILIRSWLDEPDLTWVALKTRVHAALQTEIAAHRAPAHGTENIPAYARGDGLHAIQSWIAEFEGTS